MKEIYLCKHCGGIEFSLQHGGLCPDCGIPRLIVEREIAIAVGERIRWLKEQREELMKWRNLLEGQTGTDDIAVHIGRMRQIKALRRIIWEHHSSEIMIPDVCPVCASAEFSEMLAMGRGEPANNQALPPGDTK